MTYTVKCDQMTDGWNYDACLTCKRFNSMSTKKGWNWTCSLNKGSAQEKRAFYLIWAENYLIGRGAMSEADECTVLIDYVGKNHRKSVSGGN